MLSLLKQGGTKMDIIKRGSLPESIRCRKRKHKAKLLYFPDGTPSHYQCACGIIDKDLVALALKQTDTVAWFLDKKTLTL